MTGCNCSQIHENNPDNPDNLDKEGREGKPEYARVSGGSGLSLGVVTVTPGTMSRLSR
jgi:hypothetical protein